MQIENLFHALLNRPLKMGVVKMTWAYSDVIMLVHVWGLNMALIGIANV